MKKLCFTLQLLFGVFIAFSQSKNPPPPPPPPPPPYSNDATPPTIPSLLDLSQGFLEKAYNSKKTPQHKLVTGTHAYLIPPEGMTKSTSLSGFQGVDNTVLMVFEVPVNIKKSISDLLETKTMEAKGLKTWHVSTFKLNGYDAARYIGTNNEMEMCFVVMGDSTFSLFMNGVAPLNATVKGSQMLESMNNMVYEKNVKTDPLENAKFEIDLKGTGLMYYTTMMGAIYIYSPDENLPKKEQSGGGLVIMQMPLEKDMSLDGLADDMMAKLASKGMTNNKVISTKNIKLNGVDAFEKIVLTQKDGMDKKLLIYFVSLKNASTGFAFMGMGTDDSKETIEYYRKVAKNFKLKK
jgi:hypothetical protein